MFLAKLRQRPILVILVTSWSSKYMLFTVATGLDRIPVSFHLHYPLGRSLHVVHIHSEEVTGWLSLMSPPKPAWIPRGPYFHHEAQLLTWGEWDASASLGSLEVSLWAKMSTSDSVWGSEWDPPYAWFLAHSLVSLNHPEVLKVETVSHFWRRHTEK